ncbi:transposase [Mycolicibacterium rutilum]|uniref:transposase n=1 Tax=Mycolicibacterium rutilum TaxID=370526 RepID=UPI0009F70B35|nr:transposase [Mycolicibacterium rutilum]
MSRFQLLTDAQWSLIEDLLPVRTGKKGRPFRDARSMVEGIIYRYLSLARVMGPPDCQGDGTTVARY